MLSLEKTLEYQNEDIVSRFAEDHKIAVQDAEDIFLETKRWLWLCAKKNKELDQGQGEFFVVPLFNEAYAIDMMWHTFLLFTEDYADFCEKNFGFFIHHRPKSKKETADWRQQIAQDEEAAWNERRKSLEKVYGYLYDELGAEILIRWCEEFPQRFQNLKRK